MGSSQSQIPPQVGLAGGHVFSHSRSSSNLGADDSERDADWEDDDGISASVTGGSMSGLAMGMGGSQTGEEWDSQSSRFDFVTGSGMNVSGFAPNAFGPVSGEDEWKRWAQSEIIRERRRVQRLVGVVKALVDVSSKGGASAGPTSNPVRMDGEADASTFFTFVALFAY